MLLDGPGRGLAPQPRPPTGMPPGRERGAREAARTDSGPSGGEGARTSKVPEERSVPTPTASSDGVQCAHFHKRITLFYLRT
jgi:hypothetical protein